MGFLCTILGLLTSTKDPQCDVTLPQWMAMSGTVTKHEKKIKALGLYSKSQGSTVI